MPDVFSTVQDVDSHVVLDYTSRDFTAIRSQLIGLARGILPEWETVGEPSDFGTLLLELFAYMGDVMHFYIDRTASEAFLGTALRRQSVLYIADMLGYTPIGQQSAIVRLNFGLDPNVPLPVTVPAGTRIHTEASSADDLIVFELNTEITVNPGDGVGEAPPVAGYATEGIMHYDIMIGVSGGAPNTEFIIPEKGVVYGSLSMQSREGPSVIQWSYISDLSLARPTQSVFTTFIDEGEYTHILFGDMAAGRIPPVNAEIFITYRTGVGVEANSLAASSLEQLKPVDSTIDLFGVTVTNPYSPVGGTDPESIDAMRNSIPRAATRLKNRAITLNDYADLALQVPGVAKSMAHGTVYTSVHIRVAPIQGQADDAYMDQLCSNVERDMADKIIVGSSVQVEPNSEPDGDPTALSKLWQPVFIRLKVHVQDSYNRTTVRNNVSQAVRGMLAFDAVDFGTRVSIGTIYRMALSIQGTEWVDLFWLDRHAPTPSDKASNIWTDDDNRLIADIQSAETLIPRIDDTEVTELESDWPGFSTDELIHDGLWIQAVGGVAGIVTDEWWPEGFDYPAFRVKRQTYSLSEGGDYVRGSSVETLPSTALRYPTRSLDPTAFEGASRGQMFAKAFDYHTVEVEWNWPKAVEDIFVEVAMVRSTYGAAIAPSQGQTIFRVLKDDLPTYTDFDQTVHLSPPPLIYDQQLPPGHWYYYTAFFRTNTFDWTPVMSDSTLLPRDYGHTNHLWDALPPYYQWTDDNYRAGGGHLRAFLTILGFELDRTREYVESLQKLHWTDQCPMPLLKKLGENYGYPYEQGLGDIRYRALLTNISHLHSIRGTAKGLLELVETVSKYDCDMTHGPNNVLLPDDSNFVISTGHWAPMHPDVMLPSAAPAEADYLAYDLVKLTLNLPGSPLPPAGAPGSTGTMLVDSADGGTLKDIFITIGCGKRLTTYPPPTEIKTNWGTWTATAVATLFSVTGISAWRTWTATADGTVLHTQEMVPYYTGIPVNAGEVYGFSVWIKAAKAVTVYAYMLAFTSDGQPDDVIVNGTVLDPIPSLPLVINDALWHEVKVTGQMPVGANYLVPALYFDARAVGGVGGRSPRIDVAAVMVYKVDQAAPVSILAPDRYLTMGDAAEKLGATKSGYEGFTLGAPS